MVLESLRRYTLSLMCFVGWSMVFGLSTLCGDELSWAEKMFEKRSHDFGVVATASDVSYRFQLKNIYAQQAHIASVRTT